MCFCEHECGSDNTHKRVRCKNLVLLPQLILRFMQFNGTSVSQFLSLFKQRKHLSRWQRPLYVYNIMFQILCSSYTSYRNIFCTRVLFFFLNKAYDVCWKDSALTYIYYGVFSAYLCLRMLPCIRGWRLRWSMWVQNISLRAQRSSLVRGGAPGALMEDRCVCAAGPRRLMFSKSSEVTTVPDFSVKQASLTFSLRRPDFSVSGIPLLSWRRWFNVGPR